MQPQNFFSKYYRDFTDLIGKISITENNKLIDFYQGLEKSVALITDAQKNNKKLFIIGNGGSAAIASHLSIDFWKNGQIKTFNFNDSSLLTCLSNDYSFEQVFSKPIEMFAEKQDIIIAISSSGESKNIVYGAMQARDKQCVLITLTGFSENNPLRKLGDLNFYVPSYSYGFVETIHQLIIHSILDAKMYLIDKRDVFNRNLPVS